MPAQMGDYVDPSEKKIEDARKAGKILDWKEFEKPGMKEALARLNKKDASKNDTATDMAKKQKDETKAKPFVFKKGGKVEKGGFAKVHTGERVLTKEQASKDSRGKRISCKR